MVGFFSERPKRKSVAKNLRDFIRHKQGFKCKNCGSSLKRGGNLHHKNGNSSDDRWANLELLCTKCHKEKGRIQAAERAKERKKSW